MPEPELKLSPELSERLKALRDDLLTGLVERDVPVRLALLAALSGEHLLLIGPPGTAKSLIARRLHLAFDSATYFERLLTRFTVPEELFGPLSIKGLEADRYERLTEAYLPKASIAFLDEIFKANSAILNALLTLLNEREFDNGVHRERTPLIAAVGASNELPEGEELDALFDRFLLRVHVGPVSKAGFSALLGLRGESIPELPQDLRLSTDDLAAIRSAATNIAVPDDVVSLLRDLRDWCMAEGIPVSDRRWRKVVKLLQTAALTNGRNQVSIWDCWLLQYCLWTEPEQRAKVYDWYAARAGTSAAMDSSRLTRIVVSWEAKLKLDQDSRSQARDAKGKLLFKGNAGKPVASKKECAQANRNGKPLFLAPADAAEVSGHYGRTSRISDRSNSSRGYTREQLDGLYVPQNGNWREFAHWSSRESYLANEANWLMEEIDLSPAVEPTRQKPAYIAASLKEINELQAQIDNYKQKLTTHITDLDADIRSHLWISADFAEPAKQSLNTTQRIVSELRTRIDKLRQGFEMLPREDNPADGSDDVEEDESDIDDDVSDMAAAGPAKTMNRRK